MEIIVANEENWKNRELSTKDCPKVRISCNKITGQFIIEAGKKQNSDEKKKDK